MAIVTELIWRAPEVRINAAGLAVRGRWLMGGRAAGGLGGVGGTSCAVHKLPRNAQATCCIPPVLPDGYLIRHGPG